MLDWLKKKFSKHNRNLGHRLGYQIGGNFENSVSAYSNAVTCQGDPNFLYWETDICESRDGVLYCFHDATKRKTVARLCMADEDFEHLLNYSLYQLSSKVIDKRLLLKNTDKVLRLDGFIDTFAKTATKPIKLEIKRLNAFRAQLDLLDLVCDARENCRTEISLMMKKKKFKKMINKKCFMQMCKDRKIVFKLF
jgi:glycerophosphoryl diester phosphodiesterase